MHALLDFTFRATTITLVCVLPMIGKSLQPARATSEIKEPTNPIAKDAFKTLERHCARCHQSGRLERDKPAKNFSNILQLEEIASDPNLILPGNPDGSPLFIRIVKQEMPYDVYNEFSGGEEPTEKEVQAVYEWIQSLNKTSVASCKRSDPIDQSDIVQAIARDLDRQTSSRRAAMRYLTLTNFYNACVSEKDMDLYRHGAVKLLNSLSQGTKISRLRTIGKAKAIIAFNLDDLRWKKGDWDSLLSIYPYGLQPTDKKYKVVKSRTQTLLAWLRADWFAHTASRPPFYYDLLDLPDTFVELQRQIDVNVEDNRASLTVTRAGFEESRESRQNRLIERHASGQGYFWTTYDFEAESSEKNLFKRPLGPGGKSGFVHDLNETIFSLPNGLNGFYISNSKGERLDTAPSNIIHDESQPNRLIVAGMSCFGCHARGLQKAEDEIRKSVLDSEVFSGAVRNKVEALYAPVEKLSRLMDEDNETFRNALLRAGVSPDLATDEEGVGAITHLARNYEKGLDMRLAASEYGVKTERLAAGLSKAGGKALRLKRQLEQGVVPRRQFEPQFTVWARAVSGDIPVNLKNLTAETKKPISTDKRLVDAGSAGDAQETENFLMLFSDKSFYRQNGLPTFTVQSNVDCYLSLINVDAAGKATVIYPNRYQQKNFLPAKKDLQFPGPTAPFQFRLRDTGTETVVAECNTKGGDARGIRHNFDDRDFTPLGDYRKFLSQQVVVQGKQLVEKGATHRTLLSRTAIKIEVK